MTKVSDFQIEHTKIIGYNKIMSKIDKLKETKSDLKEVFKALLYFIIGILTGTATVTYKVLTKEIEAYMIVISGIGLIITFLLTLYVVRLWHRMQKVNEDMDYD
jgi:hypothetical protein